MLGFLTDLVSSALTPRGTNARRDQVVEQRQAAQEALRLLLQISPYLSQDWQEARIDSGAARDYARRAARSLAAGRSQSLAAAEGRIRRQAAMQARRTFAASGTQNPILRAALEHAAGNQTQRALQDLASQWDAPEVRARQDAEAARLLQGYSTPSQLASFLRLLAAVQGQPQVPVSGGFSDWIGLGLGALGGGRS